MTLIFYKIIAALLIFLMGIVTVIYPLKNKAAPKHHESLELGEALASGIFLGAAFFHMLPDAIGMFNHLYGNIRYPIPELVCVGGFLLMLFLERLSLTYNAIQSKYSIPYIFTIILIIHSLTEGAALGIGSTFTEAALIFVAILAHKGSESFALCVTMLRHEIPSKRIIAIIIFFSLMTPLGIGLGTAVNAMSYGTNGELVAALFNAFAAGTFLYISTLHHIHFHQHTEDKQGLLEFCCLALGVVMMGLIAVWA